MIRNLTPHAVQVMTADGQVQLRPDAPPARLVEHATKAGSVEVAGVTVELFDLSADQVENLPAARSGVWLVVSRVVAESCPQRRDLVFPYHEVRDSAGRITACSAFGRPARKHG